ncbi:DUF2867 domain-containing protein [Sphingobium sp. AR-3-1]|uniref:DUF2867 domain-containing protein n=2 Tax=Sphingobium psychrophilum TaxID=2728834 RepID=A0A7X9ZQH1_9SPHN|nr:DUF2867 domain-containing protein [Sphingobium psychrophilum]
MLYLTRVVDTFPSVVIPNAKDRLPIEVSLIAQLGHGAGSHLFHSIAARQKAHTQYIDALEEPSAKLGGTNFELGDTTALYSFVVGPQGHPFHRHAGHRIFTAVSGSGGAQLRFSTATAEDMKINPRKFLEALHFINIPPDCLFTVRFGGETWHQFWPLSKNSLHPVFFALSSHTDELGGNLTDDLKARIKANMADIPALTEVLPEDISQLIQSGNFLQEVVPTTTLSLDAPAGTIHRKVCDTFRGSMGIFRSFWSSRHRPGGYVSETEITKTVIELQAVPEDSLLMRHLGAAKTHHQDTFMISLSGMDFGDLKAAQILELLLEGFLNNAPRGVSHLMTIRNILVKPLGLRTSPLGCPVSSLLSDERTNMFVNQYPVLDQSVEEDGLRAAVVLGARDRHLVFRSCVSVEKVASDRVNLTLGTGVRCKNLFGHFYMSAISLVHRKYISPTMLRRAADYLVSRVN